MTDRYEKIRQALAMGPTPGPWFHGAANGAHMYCVYDKRCWTDEDGDRHGETPNMVVVVSPDDGKYANAAHIAACDPDTIRELLAERDQLAAALEAAREDADALLGALRQISAWPDGGNRYGQANIKRFAQDVIDATMQRTSGGDHADS